MVEYAVRCHHHRHREVNGRKMNLTGDEKQWDLKWGQVKQKSANHAHLYHKSLQTRQLVWGSTTVVVVWWWSSSSNWVEMKGRRWDLKLIKWQSKGFVQTFLTQPPTHIRNKWSRYFSVFVHLLSTGQQRAFCTLRISDSGHKELTFTNEMNVNTGIELESDG